MRKRRHNISLPEDIRAIGEQLAEEDQRSFSGELAWLIKRESDRRAGLQKESEPTTIATQEAA